MILGCVNLTVKANHTVNDFVPVRYREKVGDAGVMERDALLMLNEKREMDERRNGDPLWPERW